MGRDAVNRPLLEIKNATKIYGKSRAMVTALRDVSLTVPAQPASAEGLTPMW